MFRKTHIVSITFILASLIMAAFIFRQTANFSNIWNHAGDTLSGVLNGTADRPFVYRALIPGLANLVSPILSKPLAVSIMQKLYPPYQSDFLGKDLFTYAPELVIISLIMYLSLVGLPFVIKRLMQDIGYTTPFFTWAIPISVLFSVYFFVGEAHHYYDYPQMFLFTLALLFLKEKRWTAYIITLLIAGINKETAVFLIPIFCGMYFFSLQRRQFWILFSLQLAAYLLPRAIILFIFRSNPGGAVIWHYSDHLKYISDHHERLFTWLTIGFLLMLFIFYQWKTKPLFLRISWSITSVIFFILFLLWGYPNEWRVFLEIYPLTLLLLLSPDLFPQFQNNL